jgi:RNA polymerase sigma factor (sigma-70 family)
MDSDDQIQFLVRRCQRGDHAAFETLFRQYQPRLRYHIRRLGNVDGRVDDLLQDIWLKVVGRVGSLRDPKAVVAWLYAIARNEVYRTSRVTDPFTVTLTDEHTEQADDDEDAERVHQALERLKAPHREILTLSFLDDLSHEQIAEVLGIQAGTIKSRLYYAKQSLRRAMEKDHG